MSDPRPASRHGQHDDLGSRSVTVGGHRAERPVNELRTPPASVTRQARPALVVDSCPLGCGYRYPIPACVRLHLIQHHNYGYAEAQEAYPDADE